MPSIKCRTCGQGNFASSAVCINCGAIIGSPSAADSLDYSLIKIDQPSSSSSQQMQSLQSVPDPLLSPDPQKGLPSASADHSVSGSLPPTPRTPPPPPIEDQQDAFPRSVRRRRIERESLQDASPHDAWSIDPDPIPGHVLSVPPRTQKGHSTDLTEKLPWSLPRYTPDLRGTLIHMDVQEQVADYPSLSLAIMDMLAEFVWAFANVTRTKEKETIVMTTLRVRKSDGTIQDARLRGRLTKAYLALGDTVSLWGPTRRGVVFINRGYNHTSKAIISTQSLDAVVPAVLMLLCFALFLVSLPFIFHLLVTTLHFHK